MVNHIIDREEEKVKFYAYDDWFLTRCFLWQTCIEICGILIVLLVLIAYI